MFGFVASGRIAWIIGIVVGVILLIIGLVADILFLTIVGIGLVALGGLFLILSLVTKGQSD